MTSTVEYKFPAGADESAQFEYVCFMMDDVEENTSGELIFNVDVDYQGHFHVEIYEHPEEEDEDNELVDWYVGKTIKDVYDFLMEKYL